MGSQQHQPIDYSSDSRYGGHVIHRQHSHQIYQVIIVGELQSQSFINLLELRKKLNHPHLISPRNYIIHYIKQPCSLQSQLEIYIEYQYANRTLQDEIIKYCKDRRPFPQPQLRRIFTSLAQVLLYLQNNNTCHGDIKPSSIMIDQYGYVKLIDSYFVNRGKTSYEIVMEDPTSMSLLSASQLYILKNRKYTLLDRVNHSQVWAMGLSMLEAMTAQPAMECYNLNNLEIKPHYFDGKFNQLLKYGYSAEIAQLVMACIMNVGECRPTFQQIIQTLSRRPHQRII